MIRNFLGTGRTYINSPINPKPLASGSKYEAEADSRPTLGETSRVAQNLEPLRLLRIESIESWNCYREMIENKVDPKAVQKFLQPHHRKPTCSPIIYMYIYTHTHTYIYIDQAFKGGQC